MKRDDNNDKIIEKKNIKQDLARHYTRANIWYIQRDSKYTDCDSWYTRSICIASNSIQIFEI